MATMRLIPSAYTKSNQNYVTVSDEDNMYNNTSHTSNYATLRGRNRNSSTAYYCFIHGFNTGDVPSNATVTSFSVKIRCYRSSNQRTGSNFYMRLAYQPSSGTVISNTTTSTNIDTTVDTITIPTGNLDWDDIVDYGSNFSIEVPLASNSNSYPYVYVYGAEIEVNYTIPNPRTITSTLSGDGTISPSGASTMYDGDEYELRIIPTNLSDAVTVKNNGTDVTSSLLEPGNESGTEEAVLGTYALTSGSFNGSGASYFSGIVGHGYDASKTTSNYYSGGSSTIAVFTYDMGIDIPSDATVTECYVMVNGHAESTSQSNEYMCAQLYSGSTAITNELNFKSVGTSNSTQTLQATTLPTASQCADLKLRCRLGYYGGAINGATLFISYQITRDCYIYTFTVSGDATIAVTIGSGGTAVPELYIRINNQWVKAQEVYKKISGSWVQQNDLTTVFDANTNYRYNN